MRTPDSLTHHHDDISLNKADGFVVIVIFLCVSIAQAVLAFHWYHLGLFSQFNVIFDSDPNIWLRYGSSTHPDVGTSKHPLAAYYAGVPVLVLSKIITALGNDTDPSLIRTTLALCVAPLVAGVKHCFIYLTARNLTLSIRDSLLVTGISVFAFSSVVFGSLPETYGYTGLLTAAGFFYVVRSMQHARKRNLILLLCTCFLSIGASTANLIGAVWLFIARGSVQQGLTLWSILRGGVIAGLVCLTTLSTFWGLSEIRGVSRAPSQVFLPNTHDINTYSPSVQQQAVNLLHFPARLSQSIVATMPVEKNNILGDDDDIYPFELSYNPMQFQGMTSLHFGFGIILLLFGIHAAYRAHGRWRQTAFLALTFIGSYALVFSFYGHNTFLYSQHWQVPFALLLGTTLRTDAYNQNWARIGLACLVCGLAISLSLTLIRLNDLFYANCGTACLG